MSAQNARSIMDGESMRRCLNRISYEIIERNRDLSAITLVGVKRRGAVLAARIAGMIESIEDVCPPVEQLDTSMFRDDLPVRPDRPESGITVDLTSRVIIIVDDVLHTGRTIRAAIEAVMLSGRPRAIQLAVLVDRGHRELPFRPDYTGKNLPTSASERVEVLVAEYDGREGVLISKTE